MVQIALRLEEEDRILRDENTTCAICLDTSTGIYYTLPCKHMYHRQCITDWLKVSPSCPFCRAPTPQLVGQGKYV
ncbi:RING finger protein 122-like [Branchiostoma floridae x Branchiostoma belcheri]